jgi:hypothetical protein
MAYDSAVGQVIMNQWGETWAYSSPNNNPEYCGTLPGREFTRLVISSPNQVLDSQPGLINIPQKAVPVPLFASLVTDTTTTPLDPGQVSYDVTHPVTKYITDPESIVNIDSEDAAHYNSEGWVIVTAETPDHACRSEEYILATGHVHGNPANDDVIAVFPNQFVPDSSEYSFGDMMSSYPDMMRYLNVAHAVTSDMYKGFRYFGGEKQILALLDVEGHCGAADNPLQTAPCCYMNCGNGSPHYNVVIHEMGHNFSLSKGMQQLLLSNGAKIAVSGFSECVASLPVIYFEEEIIANGAAYEVYPGSFEHEYATNNRAFYCAEPQRGLPEFEQMIADGLTDGIFDNPGLFDGVQVFCSFFEQFSCGYIEGENRYRHQMIRRFLNAFGDSPLPGFVPDKVETYFAAAYSVAAGRDMREKLEYWGFTIDVGYYEEIKPIMQAIIDTVIFKDGFENLVTP